MWNSITTCLHDCVYGHMKDELCLSIVTSEADGFQICIVWKCSEFSE